MSVTLRRAWLRCLVAVLAATAGGAIAQSAYPAKAIRWIVPFPPGGPSDVLARAIGQKLSENWGQQVIIDNRPGAGGNIGSDMVAKAAPDGYTLLMGYVGPIAINTSLYRNLPYNPVNDFAPVTLIASSTLMLAAHPSTTIKSIMELITRAKSSQSQLSFASPGSGTPPHLAGELLNAMAGIKIVHVPYKGAAPAVTDLLGGQVPLGIVALPAAMPHIKSGRLNALGVTSAKRSIFAPDVPTIAESGLPGYEVENWQGVLVPAGTPKEIVNKLNGEMVKILQLPEVKDRLYSQGFEIFTSTPEQSSAYLRTEIVKWARLVKSSGASVD